MTSPIVKRLLSCACALLMTWAVSNSTHAGSPFFYSSYYAPAPSYGSYYAAYAPATSYGSYYTAYAPSYYGRYGAYRRSYYGGGYYTGGNYRGGYYGVGYYGVGYRGWGPVYASYAPSHCGSACSTGCNPCGVSYAACDTGCGTCGLSSCSGCGIASIGCATGCDIGVSTPAGNPPNEPYSGPASDQRTYSDDGTDDGFRKPEPPQPDSAGPFNSVLPGANQGGDNDINIDRGANKVPSEEVIPQRNGHNPANADPSVEHLPPELPNAEEGTDVQPADIDASVAMGVAPLRTRARYTVRFHAPRIARPDVTPNRKWTPVDTDTQLAATR